MRPLGYSGGLHVILTAVSLMLGTDSVIYTPDIITGIVTNNTGDDTKNRTIIQKLSVKNTDHLVAFFLQ